MRLLIPLCKHCLRDRNDCDWYLDRKRVFDKSHLSGTFIHNCPEYYKVIPIGTKVEVEPKTMIIKKFYGEPYGEWVSYGKVTGVIYGKSYLKGFYYIRLDNTIEINYPSNNSWTDTAPTSVRFISKRPKEIKILE